MQLLVLVSIAVLFFQFVSPARADYYVFEQGRNNSFTSPQTITNPQYFQYIYALLNRGEDTVDYYDFALDEVTQGLHIELLVQDKKATKDFRPSLIVVDPRERNLEGKPPFGFPLTVGGRIYAWENLPEKKQVDDTVLENLLLGPSVVRNFSANHYTIAVFDPASTGGRYILRIGAKTPTHSLQDKFAQVLALLRIKLYLY